MQTNEGRHSKSRTPPVTRGRTPLKKELRTPNSKLFGEYDIYIMYIYTILYIHYVIIYYTMLLYIIHYLYIRYIYILYYIIIYYI